MKAEEEEEQQRLAEARRIQQERERLAAAAAAAAAERSERMRVNDWAAHLCRCFHTMPILTVWFQYGFRNNTFFAECQLALFLN